MSTIKRATLPHNTLLFWPDPKLRAVSKDVPEGDFKSIHLKSIISQMVSTMRGYRGIGLSAIQLGIPYRIFVMDAFHAAKTSEDVQVFINPVILSQDDPEVMNEGCLSIPGYYAEIVRSQQLVLSHVTYEGEKLMTQFEGLEAQCVQHECDHLDGKLALVDELGPVKRDMLRRKITKNTRHIRF